MKYNKSVILAARKIAIVRTDSLGDMILTMPMARALKELNPDCEVIFIARKYTEPLIKNSDYIDRYLLVEDFDNDFRKIFKECKPDAAFYPMPRFKEVYAAFIGNVPIRIGTAFRLYSFLFNYQIRDHRKVSNYSEAEYNIRMINLIAGTDLTPKPVPPRINESTLQNVIKLLNGYGIEQNNFITVHPGSKGSAMDWQAANFGKAAKIISEKTGLKVIATGVESERDRINDSKSAFAELIDLCGKLNLEELIALLSLAKLMISNSTGTLHIASALGTPVVGLYPNTPHISAKRWRPIGDNFIVVSPPQLTNTVYNDDMNMITPEQVAEAGIKFLL